MMAEQLDVARAEQPGDLQSLLTGGDTWTVPSP
jgi:hypothetical protein